MHLLFLIVVLSGAAYFLFARRAFDFFSLAYLSACAYFSPGIVGFVSRPQSALLRPTPIADETYLAMSAVVISIVLGGMLPQVARYRQETSSDRSLTTTASTVCTMMALVGFVLSWLTIGSTLLSPDKATVLESLNASHTLWVFSAIVGAGLALAAGHKANALICLLLLLANMLVGFRSHLVIAVLSCVGIYLARQGTQRLALRHTGMLVGMFVLGIGLMLYKAVYVLIKAGRLDLLEGRLTDPLAYQLAFQNSEPFLIQAILNEIFVREYHVAPDHMLSSIYLLVPFAPRFGAEPISFQERFQSDLFPDVVAYGMANNIWGEMYAVGGWLMLIIFLMINVSVLRIFSTAILAGKSRTKALAGACGTYWAFYIHRNDLAYELTLERRVLIIWFVAIAVATVLTLASSRSGAAADRDARPRTTPPIREDAFVRLN